LTTKNSTQKEEKILKSSKGVRQLDQIIKNFKGFVDLEESVSSLNATMKGLSVLHKTVLWPNIGIALKMKMGVLILGHPIFRSESTSTGPVCMKIYT